MLSDFKQIIICAIKNGLMVFDSLMKENVHNLKSYFKWLFNQMCTKNDELSLVL